METLKLLWFFLWRTSLLSLLVGALVGAAYGMAQLIIIAIINAVVSGVPREDFSIAGIAVAMAYMVGLGLIFGIFGMAGGLAFGSLNGLLLFAITRGFYHRQLADANRYRRVAGWVYATTPILFFMLDWVLHGFADSDQFVLSRI